VRRWGCVAQEGNRKAGVGGVGVIAGERVIGGRGRWGRQVGLCGAQLAWRSLLPRLYHMVHPALLSSLQ